MMGLLFFFSLFGSGGWFRWRFGLMLVGSRTLICMVGCIEDLEYRMSKRERERGEHERP